MLPASVRTLQRVEEGAVGFQAVRVGEGFVTGEPEDFLNLERVQLERVGVELGEPAEEGQWAVGELVLPDGLERRDDNAELFGGLADASVELRFVKADAAAGEADPAREDGDVAASADHQPAAVGGAAAAEDDTVDAAVRLEVVGHAGR